jgi:hypothetical protein
MIRTSESTKFLTAALVEFHKSEVSVPKSATNPFFKSKYADLWTIKASCDPVLSSLGLVVVQFPGESQFNAGPTLITRLSHGASGEFMEAETPLFMPKDTPQDQGSAITYMRRYAYSAILGIVADPDDDGERAMQRDKPKPRSRSSQPTFVPPAPPLIDQLEDSVQQVRAERAEAPNAELATSKQLGYLKRLLDQGGYAPSEWTDLIDKVAPPAPEGLHNLTKAQAGYLIDHLGPK